MKSLFTKENIFLAIIVVVAIFVIMTYFNGCNKNGTMKVEDVKLLLDSKDREADLKVQIAEYRIKDSIKSIEIDKLYQEAQTYYDNAYTPLRNVKTWVNTNNLSRKEKDDLTIKLNNDFNEFKKRK